MNPPLPQTVIFLVALALGFTLAYGVIAALRRWWPVTVGADLPDGVRKQQACPILRVGGLGLFAVFAASFAAIGIFSDYWREAPDAQGLLGLPFVIFGAALFLVGFSDDLFGLPAIVKLGVQVCVGLGAYECGMSIDMFTHPFADESVSTGSFSLILTVAWFVAIPNLINLVDGMDGLAGGVGLFLCLTLAILGALSGNIPLAILSLMMAGGLAAFLCFNLPPARIYMGDGGAYLIGYFIAAASLISSNKGAVSSAILVVVIALGFPILDTLLAVLRRGISGLPIMAPDAHHLHHRLQTLGISKRNLVMVLYGVFAGLSLLGLSVFFSDGYSLPIVGMVLVVAILGTFRSLGIPHNLRDLRQMVREMLAARRDVRYAYSMAQVLVHDLDRLPNKEAFWGQVQGFLLKFGIEPVPTDLEQPGNQGNRGCAGDFCMVVFPLSDERVWKLCCPTPSGSRRQWVRVLRCFHPSMMTAMRRWGDPPSELGVWVRSGLDVHHLECTLNGEQQVGIAVNPLHGKIALWAGAGACCSGTLTVHAADGTTKSTAH